MRWYKNGKPAARRSAVGVASDERTRRSRAMKAFWGRGTPPRPRRTRRQEDRPSRLRRLGDKRDIEQRRTGNTASACARSFVAAAAKGMIARRRAGGSRDGGGVRARSARSLAKRFGRPRQRGGALPKRRIAKSGALREPAVALFAPGADHGFSRVSAEPVVAVRARRAGARRRGRFRHRHHERSVGTLRRSRRAELGARWCAWRSRISAARCSARRSSCWSPTTRTRSTSAWRSRANGTTRRTCATIFDITNSGVALALQDLAKSHDRLVIFDSASSSDLTGKACSTELASSGTPTIGRTASR